MLVPLTSAVILLSHSRAHLPSHRRRALLPRPGLVDLPACEPPLLLARAYSSMGSSSSSSAPLCAIRFTPRCCVLAMAVSSSAVLAGLRIPQSELQVILIGVLLNHHLLLPRASLFPATPAEQEPKRWPAKEWTPPRRGSAPCRRATCEGSNLVLRACGSMATEMKFESAVPHISSLSIFYESVFWVVQTPLSSTN